MVGHQNTLTGRKGLASAYLCVGLSVALQWTSLELALANVAHEESVVSGLATTEQCYLVADGDETLTIIDRETKREREVGTLVDGSAQIEAIALDPVTNVLYGVDGDQLGTINTTTGAFTALDNEVGAGFGADDEQRFRDIDGLSFDPVTGELYASVRRSSKRDLLIKLDKRTGEAIEDAFGDGIDYVVVEAKRDNAEDIDDIAIDIDGVMYAIANNGGQDDDLVKIDKQTGKVTIVGKTGSTDDGDDIEGLAFDAEGQLWGSSGSLKRLYQINKQSGKASDPIALDIDSDYEGIACLISTDKDNDGIGDIGEIIIGTDPGNPDSDCDGVQDGTEIGVTTPLADTDVCVFVPADDSSVTTDPLVVDSADGYVCEYNTPVTEEEPGTEDGLDWSVQGGGCSATGDTGAASTVVLVGFALMILFAMRRRRSVSALAAAATLAGVIGTAQAQVTESFTLERFRISGDRQGVLDVEWGATLEAMNWDLGLWMGLADDPLVVVMDRGDGETRLGELVSHRVGGHLVGALGVLSWLQAGIEVPVILSQDQDLGMSPVGAGGALTRAGLGDIRVIPKLQLLRSSRHFVDVSIMPAVTLPTNTSDQYFGDGFGFAPEVAVSRSFGAVRLATNLGYRTRKSATLGDLNVDDEVFWRLGAGYRFSDAGGPPVELDMTLTAATHASDFMTTTNTNHVELLGAAQYQFTNRWLGFTAAGAGLNEGFGTPDWRVLVGVRFGNHRGESTVEPTHPARPEPNIDVSVAVDGCESLNPAQDIRFVDLGDDIHGDSHAQLDEIARVLNDDHTALRIRIEAYVASDATAEDNQRALRRAEATRAYLAGEGVSGVRMQVAAVRADRAESIGFAIVSGGDCSQPAPCKEIELDGTIHFETNKADIKHESMDKLKQVAWVLIDNPAIQLQVEGHTDNTGPRKQRRAYNRDLSQRRADAVRAALFGFGVNQERLGAKGFGEDRPIASNKTREGRSQNRRIEFSILKGGTCKCEPIEITASVLFDTNKATIKRRSHGELNDIAARFVDRPELRVEIGGHTDSDGSDELNDALSQRRAEAVKDYVVKRGVSAEQLKARGYGERVPIADNATRAGKAKNRRVVFTITKGNCQ